jgi:hypothetical protein
VGRLRAGQVGEERWVGFAEVAGKGLVLRKERVEVEGGF